MALRHLICVMKESLFGETYSDNRDVVLFTFFSSSPIVHMTSLGSVAERKKETKKMIERERERKDEDTTSCSRDQ